MRIGIFGGTFDPVHYGHLLLAECCREECGLDQVWFVPAHLPPHKDDVPVAGPEHRRQMLELAIAGHEAFQVCDVELQRGGISYTADTVEEIHQQVPHASLFLLMGADQLAEFPRWREPERICRLATLVVVPRPGVEVAEQPVRQALSEAARHQFQLCRVDIPLMGLSSSQIRQRLAQGKSVRFRVPRAVELYIQTHELYRAP